MPPGASYRARSSRCRGRRARSLDLAVAAVAVNGYGTVQQWLEARGPDHARLRPGAVLLQLSDNDVITIRGVSRRSYANNDVMPRPYLDVDGRPGLRDPRRFHERFVLGRELTRYWLAGRWPTIEMAIEEALPEPLALYREELRHAARALGLVPQVFLDAPAFAFNVGGSEGRIAGDLARLAHEAGFTYVDIGVPLRKTAPPSELLQADGAHWNEKANALAGRLLAEALSSALRASR